MVGRKLCNLGAVSVELHSRANCVVSALDARLLIQVFSTGAVNVNILYRRCFQYELQSKQIDPFCDMQLFYIFINTSRGW